MKYVCVLLFIALSHALKAFQPNCSLPDKHVTFVSSPSVRGTMDIIFGCFSVLLICTWAVQHLSVPVHREPTEHSWNRRFVKNASYSAFLDDLRFNITKLKWMVVSLLAPEYILSKALSELLAAHDSRRQFNSNEWTTTHGYFANMRGFVLRFNVAAVPTSLEPAPPDEVGRQRFEPLASGDPPYVPQKVSEAEDEELRQCVKICGDPCRNRPPVTDVNSSEHVANGRAVGLSIETNTQNKPDSLEMKPWSATSTNVDGRSPPHYADLTPSSAVEDPRNSNKDVPNSVINTHGYPLKMTPSRASKHLDYSFPPNVMPTFTEEDTERQHLIKSQSSIPDSLRPAASVPAKKVLGPHKVWRATWALSSMQMYYAYRTGIIPLPSVTAEDLNDRSKGDALVKGLAVLHIAWLVIQILSRGVERLAITQLEIMVLGFAACAIITYSLLWHKPQDVKLPVYIDIPATLNREQIIELAARSPVSTLMVHQYWLHGVAIRAMADNVFPWTPGMNFRIPLLMQKPILLNPHFVGIGGGGVVFGAAHIGAWNFEFPTTLERNLWRGSSLYLSLFPIMGVFFYCLVQHVARKGKGISDEKVDAILRPLGRVTLPIYLLARLYLLVEVFRCLAYPPTSVFEDVNWPSVIPHIT